MSRGPGRCQRAILAQVEAAPAGKLTRRELEEVLVEKGYSRSNVLRSTRALVRLRLLRLREGSSLETSVVSLPPPPEPVSDARLSDLLAEITP